MNNYIEFVHSDKSLNKNIRREVFQKVINVSDITDSIYKNNFSGMIKVYNNESIVYKISVSDGNIHGEFVKYEDFAPKSLYGTATGYIGGWRQPIIVANYRSGLLDGMLTVYKSDGTKIFVFNYNMGILDGEQKHYIEYSKFSHIYIKGTWDRSTKISKSWLWKDNTNAVDSHLDLVRMHQKNVNM